jgi:hypothetical protein
MHVAMSTKRLAVRMCDRYRGMIVGRARTLSQRDDASRSRVGVPLPPKAAVFAEKSYPDLLQPRLVLRSELHQREACDDRVIHASFLQPMCV